MSEVPILKETARSTGRKPCETTSRPPLASRWFARAALGQDKLLIDDEGRTMVSNDGVTAQVSQVEHPVANMLINASTTDRIARRHRSAVLLSAEFAKAWELVPGRHPSAIARGYHCAMPVATTSKTSSLTPPTTCFRPPPRSRVKFTKPCNTTWPHWRQAAKAVVEQRRLDHLRPYSGQEVQTGGSMTDSTLITGWCSLRSGFRPVPKQLPPAKLLWLTAD